jgi:hypothetical protein
MPPASTRLAGQSLEKLSTSIASRAKSCSVSETTAEIRAEARHVYERGMSRMCRSMTAPAQAGDAAGPARRHADGRKTDRYVAVQAGCRTTDKPASSNAGQAAGPQRNCRPRRPRRRSDQNYTRCSGRATRRDAEPITCARVYDMAPRRRLRPNLQARTAEQQCPESPLPIVALHACEIPVRRNI